MQPRTSQTTPSSPEEQSPVSLQHTLAGEIQQSGVGLHSGEKTSVRLLPAPVDAGRYFVRVDLPESPAIAAKVSSVTQTVLSTQLEQNEAKIRTVEHLLAALAGMGVDNVRIEINGAEVPLLDGSAALWVEAIAQVGVVAQDKPRVTPAVISEPIWVRHDDAFVAAIPASEIRFTYGIDFDLPAIGNQWYSWSPGNRIAAYPSTASFASEIAPARTFGLAHQIDFLQQQGLIKGGSLDNALVCTQEGWLNPPLRFANEPVRHKILDLIGDLSLLGNLPLAHFVAYKASHNLHVQLAQQIVASRR
ncbi:UDP-3-O-acyl-N-acetylglucosamine deacetylase [Chroococcidiopsis sp. TS-821]|uniref:UDP-3-O-acyl-N-acetylglucosamine deacetylase n=1 Tax=Chroococcidiopsis sp. TS-821 TaxID=1378066 RepID=UPI001FED38F2|nr:UDP-3-O-acyl-N-acetylglucosamine deacetylase [Chroococcidiopsis sp. TS-821]